MLLTEIYVCIECTFNKFYACKKFIFRLTVTHLKYLLQELFVRTGYSNQRIAGSYYCFTDSLQITACFTKRDLYLSISIPTRMQDSLAHVDLASCNETEGRVYNKLLQQVRTLQNDPNTVRTAK